jgi:hypothetical protein
VAKSKIIKELANGEISLEVALNRLLIIASDIDNPELGRWAEKELNGYSGDDMIPPYRVVKNTMVRYSGINGGFQVNNLVFPFPIEDLFPEEYKDRAKKMELTEGIRVIEEFASGDEKKEYGKDLLFLAGRIASKYGIQCYSIMQLVPQNAFYNVMSAIKLTLTKILLTLDKTYGCLDELDIDSSSVEAEEVLKISTTINQYIFNDNSITIGNKNKIEESSIS